MSDWLSSFLPEDTSGIAWLALGLFGQVLFFTRWLVQWYVSERKGASVVPLAFWYLSLGGGLLVLAYGLSVREPVLVLGQSVGATVYLRNLILLRRARTPGEPPAESPEAQRPVTG